jgi:hypothetical protein
VWVLLAAEDAPSNPKASLEEEREYVWPLTGARRKLARYVALA